MTEEAARALQERRERHVFVVEVWREGGAFRAAARDVAQEQARCFDEPGNLAAYIVEASGLTAATTTASAA